MIFYSQRTDGRSGNVTVIRILPCELITLPSGFQVGPYAMFEGISDYGNKVKWAITDNLWKTFFKTLGKTTPTHKYHDYKLNYPEYSI